MGGWVGSGGGGRGGRDAAWVGGRWGTSEGGRWGTSEGTNWLWWHYMQLHEVVNATCIAWHVMPPLVGDRALGAKRRNGPRSRPPPPKKSRRGMGCRYSTAGTCVARAPQVSHPDTCRARLPGGHPASSWPAALAACAFALPPQPLMHAPCLPLERLPETTKPPASSLHKGGVLCTSCTAAERRRRRRCVLLCKQAGWLSGPRQPSASAAARQGAPCLPGCTARHHQPACLLPACTCPAWPGLAWPAQVGHAALHAQ